MQASAAPLRGQTILVAEDEYLLARDLVSELERQGANLRPTVQPWATRNRLLAGLARQEFETLSPFLQPCDLASASGIAGETDPHVYFPESAIVTVFSHAETEVDLGPVGRDGAIGLGKLFGGSPFDFVVNEPGTCLRIPTAILSRVLEQGPGIRHAIMAYETRRQSDIAALARANALCTVEQRLARYLLAYRDKCDGNQLRLTHGVLSVMLGVRRPGVTDAMHLLESTGAIRNTRGLVTIRDAEALWRIADGGPRTASVLRAKGRQAKG